MEERPRYIVVLFSGNGIPILRVNVNVDLSSAQMHVRFPILYIQASHWLIFLLGNYTQSVHRETGRERNNGATKKERELS